jgi:hypothetical protein
LRRALPALGEGPFFLVNADVLCDVDLRALARAHAVRRERFGARLTLTVFTRPPLEPGERQAERYREVLLSPEGDRVAGLGEPAEGRPFFTGVAVIEPEALRGAPAGGAFEMVPHVLRPAIEAGRAGAFVTAFKAAYGEPQYGSFFGATSYDATKLLAKIIGEVGTDGTKIKDALYALKSYDGIIGTFSFDENGDVKGVPFAMKQFKAGVLVQSELIPLN